MMSTTSSGLRPLVSGTRSQQPMAKEAQTLKKGKNA
jgi:hypothetical protein